MKKNVKRALSLALAVGLWAVLILPAQAAGVCKFPDVKQGDWYYDAVTAMQDSGIVNGCDDGLFHPERVLTEGDWCTMLLRAATYDGANLTGGVNAGGNHWASGVVVMCNRMGLTNCWVGQEEETVTRGEAVTGVMELVGFGQDYFPQYSSELDKLLASKGIDPRKPAWTLDKLPDMEGIVNNNRNVTPEKLEEVLGHIELYKRRGDEDQVYGAWVKLGVAHSWNAQSILTAYNYGVCRGVDRAGTFRPIGRLTRGEAVQLLYQAGLTRRWRFYHGKNEVTGANNAVAYDFDSTENVVR